MQAWLLALASIFLAAAGQILIKWGLNGMADPDLTALGFLTAALTSVRVMTGLAAYGVSVILWLLALRTTPLTLLYPLVSLSYVLVAAGSVWLLGESMPPGRMVGIAVIMLGVVLVARS